VLLDLLGTLYAKPCITFAASLHIPHIPLYTANNIRMLQSDTQNIAIKATGKAFAEGNNCFNFFVENSQW
jgi:hypothetical protein